MGTNRVVSVEQADGQGNRRRGSYHGFLKQAKLRSERRRAKANPECFPAYRRFRGWES